jgi:hypothetical protein
VLRIATFNLLHGLPVLGGMPQPQRDSNGKFSGPPEHTDDASLRLAAQHIDADIIGLQEVDCYQSRSGTHDQTSVVAQALDAPHHLFAPSVMGTPGDPAGWRAANSEDDQIFASGGDTGPMYGVGLVSRLPVEQWHIERFSAPKARLPLIVPSPERRPTIISVPDEPRTAIIAVITGANGPFTVATAHLSFVPGVNIKQLRQLVRAARDFPRPFFLIGDFNLPGRWPSRVTKFASLARGATYPSFSPRIQFDHVLADGLSHSVATTGRTMALKISDHCAVVVDVEEF